MSGILTQLATLLLRALPPAVLLAVVWIGYDLIVHGKPVSVLSERRQRREGAMEKAHADIRAAEARSAEFEQQIRDGKLAVYKAQELRRRQQLEARTAALAEARKAADARVQSARESLQAESTRVKARLQPDIDSIVKQIIRVVLKLSPTHDSMVTRG
jgi:F0F1-type ATP synthase membrane subunit b/b'